MGALKELLERIRAKTESERSCVYATGSFIAPLTYMSVAGNAIPVSGSQPTQAGVVVLIVFSILCVVLSIFVSLRALKYCLVYAVQWLITGDVVDLFGGPETFGRDVAATAYGWDALSIAAITVFIAAWALRSRFSFS